MRDQIFSNFFHGATKILNYLATAGYDEVNGVYNRGIVLINTQWVEGRS